MSEDAAARLVLLALIEGNSRFWTGQLRDLGAVELLAQIKAGAFHEDKHGALRIHEMSKRIQLERLVESIVGFHLLTPDSPDWPIQLNQLAAPPFALLARGERSALALTRESLSVVGSRNPSPYGARVASEISSAMSDRGYLIISGGALGIDSDAHRGALAADGSTIAVLGGGLRDIYPATNARLYEEISETGLLISEVLPDVKALPFRFLIRNRLIAALGSGTLVVEAALRSGSIRTARDACELFRPVMAIPGSITSPTSAGCHALIAERKAELVTSAEEIVQLIAPL